VHSTFSKSERRALPITGMAFYPWIASTLTLMSSTSESGFSMFSIVGPGLVQAPIVSSLTPKGLDSLESQGDNTWPKRPSTLKIDSHTHYQRSCTISSETVGSPELTPDMLRELVRLSEGIREPVQLASSQIQNLSARIELQEEEQKRQLQLEQELIMKFSALQDGSFRTVLERFQHCTRKRDELKSRIEKVQKALIMASSPGLSSEERLWFSELEQLRKSLRGTAEWDMSSLCSRIEKLNQLLQAVHALRNNLIRNGGGNFDKFSYTSPRPKIWGTDQMHRYVNRLQNLQKSIEDLQARTSRELEDQLTIQV